MSHATQPRKPSKEEIAQLQQVVVNDLGFRDATEKEMIELRREAKELVSVAAIGVFDDYMTDGPGYAGKLMFVVWSGSPDFYEVYVWRKGGIRRLPQAEDVRREPKAT